MTGKLDRIPRLVVGMALVAGAATTVRAEELGDEVVGCDNVRNCVALGQKRAGTVTALVARGDKLQSSVPAPPHLPAVTALPIEPLKRLPPIPRR
jgi:hypothetical protein